MEFYFHLIGYFLLFTLPEQVGLVSPFCDCVLCRLIFVLLFNGEFVMIKGNIQIVGITQTWLAARSFYGCFTLPQLL